MQNVEKKMNKKTKGLFSGMKPKMTTVAAATATIQQTLDNLAQVSEHRTTEAATKEKRIKNLEDELIVDKKEAQDASRLAAKLNSFFND